MSSTSSLVCPPKGGIKEVHVNREKFELGVGSNVRANAPGLPLCLGWVLYACFNRFLAIVLGWQGLSSIVWRKVVGHDAFGGICHRQKEATAPHFHPSSSWLVRRETRSFYHSLVDDHVCYLMLCLFDCSWVLSLLCTTAKPPVSLLGTRQLV